MKNLAICILLSAAVGCSSEVNPRHPAIDQGIPLEVRAKADPDVFQALGRGETQTLLLVLNENLLERQAVAAGEPPLPDDVDRSVEQRALLIRKAASDMSPLLSSPGTSLLDVFSPIPVLSIRVSALQPFIALLRDSRILFADKNRKRPRALAQSLPMIGQPAAFRRGRGGRGVTVAIMDTGVDPRRDPSFAGRIRHMEDFTMADDGLLDDCDAGSCHGTNVSAIVLGVAPEADLVVLDVFDGDGAWDIDLLRAYRWIIDNRNIFNIVAINMSLGSDPGDTCPAEPNEDTRAFQQAIRWAAQLRILTVAASGNESDKERIGYPACTRQVASVGAVFDAGRNRDQVTDFSNSSPTLTLLAPGSCISAGMLDPAIWSCDGGRSFSMEGTSQASPHVAGAAAVLRAAYPWMGPNEIIQCLRKTGVMIEDTNGVRVPRLNLDDATAQCDKCYARCCDGNLQGPSYQADEGACRSWGERACGVTGAIRVEYNDQPVTGVGAKCGHPCNVRCCDGYLAGPEYFDNKLACSESRRFACVGHGGPARVQFDGAYIGADETNECAKRCEYLCCDGYTPATSQKSDRSACLGGRSVCAGHGDAVAVTYAGLPIWTGNGICAGTCSASCCNGTVETTRVNLPRSCISANLCTRAGIGGASRTVFKPDLAKHAGFPVKSDSTCNACSVRCCDSSVITKPYAAENLCQRDIVSFCGPTGATKDATYNGSPISISGAACVVASARCCKNDPADPEYDPKHGHLEGPKYVKDGATAETEAPLWCSGYGGALRLQVDGRYRTSLKPGCVAGPAYAICKEGAKIGPVSYLDCKDDLMTLIGELKQECSDDGGLTEVEYKGKTVWDRGKESCP